MNNSLEEKRLNAIRDLEILDTATETDFDDLVKLAATIFEVPISTVTILDADRQWFKASIGLSVKETPRAISFCTHAIEQIEPLVVANTLQDVRFAQNPLVQNEPHLGFYAGVPLRSSDDLAVGTFCIMDTKPRQLTPRQLDILKILANQANKLLELRLERNKYRNLLIDKELVNQALQETEQRWKIALESVGDGVWDWNINNGNVIFSSTWKGMLGYADDELTGDIDDWLSLIHDNDVEISTKSLNDYISKKNSEYRLEHRLLCKDGNYKWILSRGMVVEWNRDGSPKRMIGTHTDISKRKEADDINWRQANFDSLTGLPNRHMFFDKLNAEIKKSERKKNMFALMFIDLDGFKEVNDKYGHNVGDDLLRAVTHRISERMRASDTFARLGGDEFTIILNDIEDIKAAGAVAEKILKAIAIPFQLSVGEICISASIGVSIYPHNGITHDRLVISADRAMYAAKNQGKNSWVYASHYSETETGIP